MFNTSLALFDCIDNQVVERTTSSSHCDIVLIVNHTEITKSALKSVSQLYNPISKTTTTHVEALDPALRLELVQATQDCVLRLVGRERGSRIVGFRSRLANFVAERLSFRCHCLEISIAFGASVHLPVR